MRGMKSSDDSGSLDWVNDEWVEEEIERFTLKPAEKIRALYPEADFSTDSIREDGEWITNKSWTINGDMCKKLGSGVYYNYRKLNAPLQAKVESKFRYTHLGQDGWYYHESWFETNDPVVEEFNDAEFEI